MEVIGVVTSNHITNDSKVKYNVVKFKNAENVNQRLFVTGMELSVGQKVKVTIQPEPIQVHAQEA